ncbi:MAG: site-2 protease family protein [Clostridia bacterium]|nr:site-2 protease family protein [Clostridia bacterium]
MKDFIIELCLLIPTVIVALTMHEYAHALVANWQGDKTAKHLGRLTLNPLKHLDPIGAICLLFFHFGWAKPVPIDPYRFKRPRLGLALVSIAGPIMNLLLAFIGAFFYVLSVRIYLTVPMSEFASNIVYAWILFNNFFSLININLAIFNLLPIPPLDGSKVLFSVLPERTVEKIQKYQMYISIGFLVILFLDRRLLNGNLTYGLSFLSGKIFDGFTKPFYNIFF